VVQVREFYSARLVIVPRNFLRNTSCMNDLNEYFVVGSTDVKAVGGSVGSINPSYCVK
jgi:hypothetical protein